MHGFFFDWISMSDHLRAAIIIVPLLVGMILEKRKWDRDEGSRKTVSAATTARDHLGTRL
jgi:hypothetical protein